MDKLILIVSFFFGYYADAAFSDSVRVNNFPATQAVTQSGTWNINSILNPVSITGTVNVSGGLTDAQLRASPVPVSLASVPTHPVTQSGAWSVDVNNFPVTQAVNGTVTANIGTTNGLALDSTVNSLLKPASTLAAVTQITNAVTIKADTPANQTNALKVDGSAVTQPISGSVSVSNFPATQAVTQSGAWNVGITGTLPAFASTPTVNLGTIAGVATESTLNSIDGKTPALGQGLMAASVPVAIASNQTAIPVTGTFFQATQPVSIASSVAVTGPLTDTQLRASAVPVSLASTTITNFPATQPISAASLPLPTGASTLVEQQSQTTVLNQISGFVGGIFNTTLPTLTNGQKSALQLDSKGRILRGVDNGRISYAAATPSAGFTAAATANQDVWRISGSATKTVYVKKIRITATATAVQGNRISLIKRSTANTGGTLVANALVPYDSTDVAATASVAHYTAAPTSGTSIGQVRTASYLIPTATGLYNSEMIFEFVENEGNPLVLRGTQEGLGIVFGVAPGGGNLISISVEWDEE